MSSHVLRRRHAATELYMTPAMMTPKMWDALAEAAKWSRANADVLVDTHWIGGNPDRGEVYAMLLVARKGVVALRNPSRKPASYCSILPRHSNCQPHATTAKKSWRRRRTAADRRPAGQRHRFELKPFEVLVLEATPATSEVGKLSRGLLDGRPLSLYHDAWIRPHIDVAQPELLAGWRKWSWSAQSVSRRMKGNAASPRKGQSVEFADFRNYVPGDDLRFVDWNTYAGWKSSSSRCFSKRKTCTSTP